MSDPRHFNKDGFHFAPIHSGDDNTYRYQRGYFERGLLNGWGIDVSLKFEYFDGETDDDGFPLEEDYTIVHIEYRRGYFLNGKLNGVGLHMKEKCALYNGKHSFDENLPWEKHVVSSSYEIGMFYKDEWKKDDEYSRLRVVEPNQVFTLDKLTYKMDLYRHLDGFCIFKDDEIQYYFYQPNKGLPCVGLCFCNFKGKALSRMFCYEDKDILSSLLQDVSQLSEDERAFLKERGEEEKLQKIYDYPDENYKALVKDSYQCFLDIKDKYGIFATCNIFDENHYNHKHEGNFIFSITIETMRIPVYFVLERFDNNYIVDIGYKTEVGGPNIHIIQSIKTLESRGLLFFDHLAPKEKKCLNQEPFVAKKGSYYGYMDNDTAHGMGIIMTDKIIIHGQFYQGDLDGFAVTMPRQGLDAESIKGDKNFAKGVKMAFYQQGKEIPIFKKLTKYINDLLDNSNDGKGVEISAI